jgi:hypothetical protein
MTADPDAHQIDVVYTSIYHPGDAPRQLVYARWLRRPLGFAITPILVIALILALVGESPLIFLVWAVPLAYVVATGWTLFQLRHKLAALQLRPGFASVHTVWQVAANCSPDWEPLLRIVPTGFDLQIGIGGAVYTILPDEWPDYGVIENDLSRSIDGLTPRGRSNIPGHTPDNT